MTVDAHQHLWDLDVRDQSWITGAGMEPIQRDFRPADLRAALRGTTVDKTVLVQTTEDPDETPELLVQADTCDRVRAVVGWVDLTARDVRGRLAELQAHPSARWLRGIRHRVAAEDDPDWLIRPAVLAGLGAVEDSGFLYELLLRPDQLSAAAKAADQRPQLSFVLDHCGAPPVSTGGWEPWCDQLRELAARPNVRCKLSGLVTADDRDQWRATDGVPDGALARLRPYFDVVLDAFGPDRLMFGSGWPTCLIAASYGQVLDLAAALTERLSADEREAIFTRTASEAYRIDHGR